MPTACVIQSDSRIHLASERLEVFGRNEQTQRDEILRQIPIRDIDRLILAESVQVTAQAMAALLRAQIPISVLGWSGQVLGSFLPADAAHGQARLQQYRCTQDPVFSLQMAGRIVAAKIYNQRRVVQRLGASRSRHQAGETQGAGGRGCLKIPFLSPRGTSGERSEERGNHERRASSPQPSPPSDGGEGEIQNLETALAGGESELGLLDGLLHAASRAANIDELRGYEGAATARYFACWGRFLPPEFPFERRSTRPPLNAVNACISFASTLLYSEMAAFIHAHGLDASLGLLHSTENGRWSLALDLIEPFRPALGEALTLDLFSHQILGKAHFENRNGGVYLNDEGRKKFLLQYERRFERQFMSEAAGHRTTLRQQLENQAILFKSSLYEPETFQPFLIN